MSNPVLVKQASKIPIEFRLTVRGYINNEGTFCDKIGVKEGYDWETLLKEHADKIYPDMKITIKESNESSVLFDASFVNRSARTADLYVRLNYFLQSTKFLIPGSLEIIG